jgi:hypothetical protein
MPQPLDGIVVLSNRFGHGPFKDFQPFVRVVLPQGIEIEGVYERLPEYSRRSFGSTRSLCRMASGPYTVGMRMGTDGEGRQGDDC